MKFQNIFRLALFLISFALVFSCNKDDDPPIPVDNTPADVVGTLNLPYDVNGKSWHIVFDEDLDLSNGYVHTDDGICGEGTTVSISIKDVPKGVFYVYARVSINSEFGSSPLPGDLIGIYGGSFLGDIPDAPNFTVPQRGKVDITIDLEEVPDFTPADVVGTLNLPLEANGKNWHIVFDEDLDPTNGYIHTDNGICGEGTTVSFSMEDVPEGTFFVYARVSVNSQFGSPYVPGDLVGIYGWTPPDELPNTPNFTVPEHGIVDISINMIEVPDDSPADVVGTLNLPLEANGKNWHLVFDDDLDLTNGYTHTDSGVCGEGTTISIAMEDVPEGVFFVYGRVSVNSEFGSPPLPGDLIGIYGGSFPDNIPNAPNFTVPEHGEVAISIDMIEMP